MCRIIHLFCVLRYLLDSLIINSALHTDRVIWLDKFAALIFSDYESFFCFFFNTNKQIQPVRPLHLSTNALKAQKAHQY